VIVAVALLSVGLTALAMMGLSSRQGPDRKSSSPPNKAKAARQSEAQEQCLAARDELEDMQADAASAMGSATSSFDATSSRSERADILRDLAADLFVIQTRLDTLRLTDEVRTAAGFLEAGLSTLVPALGDLAAGWDGNDYPPDAPAREEQGWAAIEAAEGEISSVACPG
jgi:hypothetical protein